MGQGQAGGGSGVGGGSGELTRKRELDEKTLQQLRGIFAAHDEDRDLMLTKGQLAGAHAMHTHQLAGA